jgi:hypothetical protein
MDQHNLSLMVALFIFLGTPLLLLYVWRTKHIPGLPRKAYPLCLMVCGGAFKRDRLHALCSGLRFPVGPRIFRDGGKGSCHPDGSTTGITSGLICSKKNYPHSAGSCFLMTV